LRCYDNGWKILKGGEYLVVESSCADVFTPEDFTDEQRQMGETSSSSSRTRSCPIIEEIDKQNFDLVVEGMKNAASSAC
jgi:hypothetical protein